MDVKFSIVMATYNSSKWINEAVNSVINQTLDFKENIQLIIVDDGSTDNTGNLCKEYAKEYPNNIEYIYQENNGQASARNQGLKYVKGEYVNFLDSDDKLELNACSEVLNFYKEYEDEVDVVSMPLVFFGASNDEHILNYKFETTRLVDLLEEPTFIQLSASSAFIKKDALKNLEFNKKLITSEDALLINQILLEKCKMGVISSTKYYYRRREDYTSTTDNFTKRKEYYNDQIEEYIKKIIEYSKKKLGYTPPFIQYLAMYTLQWIFEIPQINDILTPQETIKLYENLEDVLQDISDEIILSQKNISENLKVHILELKHNGFKKYIENNTENLKIQTKTFDTLGLKSLWIDIIEIQDDTLYISGYLPSFFKNELTKIKAVKITNNGEEEFTAKEVIYPTRNEFSLGKPIEERLHIDIKIPVKPEPTTIYFKIRYDIEVDLPIQFSMNARLSRTSHYFRTSYNKKQIKLNQYLVKNIDNSIVINPYTFKNYLKLELSTLRNIYRTKKPFYKETILLRIIQFILINTIYKNKKIWLFMDRQNTAKDNAEHLFKYSTKQKDKIKKYFIIDKQSSDYNKLKKYGKVVNFQSFKHKILFLLADKIISSHPDDDIFNPFWGEQVYLLNGLLFSQYIFLQHGIINENISPWLKKCDMNLTIFVCSAQKEYDSIFQYPYNYEKEVVQILGLPRYDALNNDNLKNQILIMPSWRHLFNNMEDNDFKATAYFKEFNKLINDTELIDYCESKGYKLIFKPHPRTIDFIHLFDRNPDVIIDDNFKMEYTDVLSQSKLMITDNSSVFYDFSYLKKPIVYYHFKGDTPKFTNKESEFDFENDGFGEVIKTHEELVKIIKEYIETDCKIKDIYNDRIDKFYTFHDKNNCKRNYNAIMKLYQ